jgi:ribosomal protein S18 acetylase RimI-like enzyme
VFPESYSIFEWISMSIIKKILSSIFQSFECYLFESKLIKRNEFAFLPKISNFEVYIITAKKQLDELGQRGINLTMVDAEACSAIGKGAIAVFLIVNGELASMEWAVLTEEANKMINIYPLKIDFARKEAYASGSWTDPKYRFKGLHIYVYYKVYEFLREQGITTVKSIVATDNIAAQKAHTKFIPEEKVYARARYIRILGFKFWNERQSGISARKEVGENIQSMPVGSQRSRLIVK